MSNDVRPKLLVVDDMEANIDILIETLGDDYAVRVAIDGPTALASVQKAPPDLILLDVMMPGMDGFEVCQRLKADASTAGIPIVFVTALSDDIDMTRGLRLGAIDYITKPYNPSVVKARVRNHLELKQHRDMLSVLVADRTLELAIANEHLKEMSQLKDDFLEMISHEIRTPANGVLGIGELIIDLCPPSEECTLYSYHFLHSKARLLNLIEDAALISNMDHSKFRCEAAFPFIQFVTELRERLPEVRLVMDLGEFALVQLVDDQGLLLRAMETTLLLATHFSTDKHAIRIAGAIDDGCLRLRFDLDNFSLPEADTREFFEITSLARSKSLAEELGLAPVVAHRIIAAFGGQLELVKGPGKSGYLEARLQTLVGLK